jgi:phage terminase large subunit GpA-like protein
MWTVDHVELGANPADERDWDKLDAYLQTKFEHAAGGKLGVEAAAVDTGGHFTHQAYLFCRQRAQRRVLAVRGETRHGMPVKGRSATVEINFRGKVLKHGVRLWHVGTDTAKDLIHGRLKVAQPGPGRVHFSRELGADFYDQITAEVRVLQKTAQGEQHRWVKRRARNEALDCMVYAIFAAHMLDLHRYTESMWARLEAAVQPPTRDLFQPLASAAMPTPAPEPETPTDVDPGSRAVAGSDITPPRRLRARPSFATRW